MPEHVEPVVQRQHDAIATTRQLGAVRHPRRSRSSRISSAVDVNQDRLACRRLKRRRPHIEDETVLALRLASRSLEAGRSMDKRLLARPSSRRHPRGASKRSAPRVRAIGDAEKFRYLAARPAPHPARGQLRLQDRVASARL